jgi:enamidase
VQRSIAALDVNGAGARDLIAELVRARVAITSTLTIFETFVASQPSAPAKALDALLPKHAANTSRRAPRLAKSTDTT